MNGGMYKKDHSPQGLYVEKGKLKTEVDRQGNGYGNFYLQPNGIFYLTQDGQAHISPTHSSLYFTSMIRYLVPK